MYILIKIAQSYTLYLSKPYLCTDFYTIELKIMKKTLFLALIAVLMIACDGSKQQFTVEGQVDGANGKTLYFEPPITLLLTLTIILKSKNSV